MTPGLLKATAKSRKKKERTHTPMPRRVADAAMSSRSSASDSPGANGKKSCSCLSSHSQHATLTISTTPLVPQRRKSRGKTINYALPSLRNKLRQGDSGSFDIYSHTTRTLSKPTIHEVSSAKSKRNASSSSYPRTPLKIITRDTVNT